MLSKRIVTAALLLVGLLVCLFWLNELAWTVAMVVPLAAALYEWAGLCGLSRRSVAGYVLFVIALTVVIYLYGLSVWSYGVALMLWLLVVPVWLVAGWQAKSAWLRLPLGFLILTPLWCALVELRAHGPWWVLLFMGVVWVADSAAYFSGRLFGRHKLAPNISPGKTWEGVLGALVAVMAYSFVVLLALFRNQPGLEAWIVPVMLLAVLMLYLSVLGDLFESWIKRLADVKDSGNLLPGHGGLLDRVDALTSTLPIATLIVLHPDILRNIMLY